MVDTSSAYSRFGQLIIMLLFQAGGLGILSLGTLLAFATGRRVGFNERLRLQAQISAFHTGGTLKLLRFIATFVVIIELAGAALLYPRFAQQEGALTGIFYALFHSISAFNNAGFALYPDSLMRFQHDPLVTGVIMLLILIGGLGFTVIINLLSYARNHRKNPLSLHSKLALITSGSLLIVGFMSLLALEWANPGTLGGVAVWEKMLQALFQSVTARTAGFNTLELGALGVPALLIMMVLMIIGANPGSTGGGIKTVTFAVLMGSVGSVIRSKKELHLFGRCVADNTVMRAGMIATVAMLTVTTALFLLSITDASLGFLALFFETISAFATVGLSLGVTPELSHAGQGILILLMYTGRVGLLNVALTLVRTEADDLIRYPSEDVIVG